MLRVERDSMPPGSPYKRDSHASAVLPTLHVETRCMGSTHTWYMGTA